ncbi:class I SAM-dependent methyltransferase [Micromonospora sp. KC207]|uniref:class I SAM-dependent methyltransferase n=1 Tax=Micromonospora sp. KC207 TaxID=2530377 RepID=UPI00104EC798|nr:class I SAM-dependent methyltransferase [Micromonospora sp. KC207]TDC61602.1 class I SAM-dependent methyltransferase [Micromonospora sp. KC207]
MVGMLPGSSTCTGACRRRQRSWITGVAAVCAVARFLVHTGHRVTGIDISVVQIERARRLVPAGTFPRVDATRLDVPPASG